MDAITNVNGKQVKWYLTGEVVDEVSIHDYEEGVEGFDDDGNEYFATAVVSCGDIVEIYFE